MKQDKLTSPENRHQSADMSASSVMTVHSWLLRLVSSCPADLHDLPEGHDISIAKKWWELTCYMLCISAWFLIKTFEKHPSGPPVNPWWGYFMTTREQAVFYQYLPLPHISSIPLWKVTREERVRVWVVLSLDWMWSNLCFTPMKSLVSCIFKWDLVRLPHHKYVSVSQNHSFGQSKFVETNPMSSCHHDMIQLKVGKP